MGSTAGEDYPIIAGATASKPTTATIQDVTEYHATTATAALRQALTTTAVDVVAFDFIFPIGEDDATAFTVPIALSGFFWEGSDDRVRQEIYSTTGLTVALSDGVDSGF